MRNEGDKEKFETLVQGRTDSFGNCVLPLTNDVPNNDKIRLLFRDN